MSPNSLTVAVGGLDLEVDVVGSGDPVVVLHGFTGSAAAMAPLVDRLSGARRVIVPDLVGHGRSSVPDERSDYTVEAMVGHVLAVADAVGVDRFDLIGYSMGGRVALTLACRDPTPIRSLVLMGASPGLADSGARADRREADEGTARSIEDDFESFVDAWMAGPLFSGQARLGDRFRAEARAQRLAADPAGLAASLRAAGTGSMAPLHERLGECRVPTLLVVGETDAKFRGIATEMADRIPSARVEVIDSAGHAAHVEEPGPVAAAIEEFLDRQALR